MLGIQNGRGRMKIIYNLIGALNMKYVFSFSLYSILDSTSPTVVVVVETYADDFPGIVGTVC